MAAHSNKPVVYFLPWGDRARLPELLERSGMASAFGKGDFVAIKMHFGERGNDGFIKPDFVRPVIKAIRSAKADPFLTDTNTIYSGPRNNAIGHLTVAAEHGFTHSKLGVPIIIADGLRGEEHTAVKIDGEIFKSVKIAASIRQADAIVALSHFKGHLVTGFGGAIKNLGMGCGSRLGKFEMHSSVSPTYTAAKCTSCGLCVKKCGHGAITEMSAGISIDLGRCVGCGECVLACNFGALSITWSEGAASVQQRCAEYALGAVKDMPHFCVNFINHVTPNCDCLSKGEKPLIDDIGILASLDPVAIDQASLDLVLKAGRGDVFAKAHPGIDCTLQLAHAEKVGLGSRNYKLENI